MHVYNDWSQLCCLGNETQKKKTESKLNEKREENRGGERKWLAPMANKSIDFPIDQTHETIWSCRELVATQRMLFQVRVLVSALSRDSFNFIAASVKWSATHIDQCLNKTRNRRRRRKKKRPKNYCYFKLAQRVIDTIALQLFYCLVSVASIRFNCKQRNAICVRVQNVEFIVSIYFSNSFSSLGRFHLAATKTIVAAPCPTNQIGRWSFEWFSIWNTLSHIKWVAVNRNRK